MHHRHCLVHMQVHVCMCKCMCTHLHVCSGGGFLFKQVRFPLSVMVWLIPRAKFALVYSPTNLHKHHNRTPMCQTYGNTPHPMHAGSVVPPPSPTSTTLHPPTHLTICSRSAPLEAKSIRAGLCGVFFFDPSAS